MKITDEKIIKALKDGKRICLPEFTSNDEFFLSSNGVSITSAGRILVAGEKAVIPLQINLIDRDDWEIVEY